MSELNERQMAKLTAHIVRWMLEDPQLLRDTAREQAGAWTLEEYEGLFREETDEEQI